MHKLSIPSVVREQQINNLPHVMFVRWDGTYRNSHSKAVCRCLIDGCEWSSKVTNLIHGKQGCPRCAGNQSLTSSDVISAIAELQHVTFVGWDGEYKNTKSKVIVMCNIDGFKWSVSVTSLLRSGKGCPQCSNRRRWTADERIAQINDIDNVTFVCWDGEYTDSHSKALCRCESGHEWLASVTSLLDNGSGCPSCADYGYNPDKPATLYALRSECGKMVKIGISNNYEHRHAILKRKTPFQFECVELCHGDGSLIATLEKVLHDLMTPIKFERQFDGSTEWREWDDRLPTWFEMYRSWS